MSTYLGIENPLFQPYPVSGIPFPSPFFLTLITQPCLRGGSASTYVVVDDHSLYIYIYIYILLIYLFIHFPINIYIYIYTVYIYIYIYVLYICIYIYIYIYCIYVGMYICVYVYYRYIEYIHIIQIEIHQVCEREREKILAYISLS